MLVPITVQESKAYIGITLFMGVKKLPSVRLYWQTSDPLLHYSVISSIMSRDTHESITRCVHCVDNLSLEYDKSSPTYDTLQKIRWVFDEIRD